MPLFDKPTNSIVRRLRSIGGLHENPETHSQIVVDVGGYSGWGTQSFPDVIGDGVVIYGRTFQRFDKLCCLTECLDVRHYIIWVPFVLSARDVIGMCFAPWDYLMVEIFLTLGTTVTVRRLLGTVIVVSILRRCERWGSPAVRQLGSSIIVESRCVLLRMSRGTLLLWAW